MHGWTYMHIDLDLVIYIYVSMYMYVSIIYTLCRHGAPMHLLDLCLPWACQVQHVAYVVGERVGMELITMTRFAEGSTPPNPPSPILISY